MKSLTQHIAETFNFRINRNTAKSNNDYFFEMIQNFFSNIPDSLDEDENTVFWYEDPNNSQIIREWKTNLNKLYNSIRRGGKNSYKELPLKPENLSTPGYYILYYDGGSLSDSLSLYISDGKNITIIGYKLLKTIQYSKKPLNGFYISYGYTINDIANGIQKEYFELPEEFKLIYANDNFVPDMNIINNLC